MQIVVIHGDDAQASWQRLKKIEEVARRRGWEISQFDPNESISFPELISSGNLFAKERLFVVGDGATLAKKDYSWLGKNLRKFEGNLVIYFDDFVPVQIQKYLPKQAKKEEFKLPKILFKFLDGLYPGNSKNSLILFHKLLVKEPVELLFNLIGKRFKELYWVKKAAPSLNYPAWRKNILKNQAGKFAEEKLMEIIASLAQADAEVKTGKAEISAILDLTMLTKLQ